LGDSAGQTDKEGPAVKYKEAGMSPEKTDSTPNHVFVDKNKNIVAARSHIFHKPRPQNNHARSF